MRTTEDNALRLLLVAVSLAFASILAPFYGAVLWGIVFAILFTPLYRWLTRSLRWKRTGAALATVLIIVVMLILPLILLASALTTEASGLYLRIQSGELNVGRYLENVFDALPSWVVDALQGLGVADLGELQARLSATLLRSSQLLARRAFNLGQNMLSFVMSLFVMLYLLFFLVRDGAELTKRITAAIPMRPERLQALADRFTAVVRATVKSNLVIAVLQGTLGALIFTFLGIRSPLLWGALMAVLSLLPLVGAILVWLPAAVYLLTTGSVWQGIVLIVFGVLVIGLVDNVVRPLMVGKDASMPDYLVLISTLGGIATFGLNGFIIGPLIAAMFVATWDIFALEPQRLQRETPRQIR